MLQEFMDPEEFSAQLNPPCYIYMYFLDLFIYLPNVLSVLGFALIEESGHHK